MNKLLFVLMLITLGACQPEAHVSPQPASDVAAASSVQASSVAAEMPSVHKWDYFEKKDEMREEITYFASLSSLNKVDIGYPYGEVSLTINFSAKKPKEKSEIPDLQFYLIVSDGMVDCDVSDGCRISYKFDNEEIKDDSFYVFEPAGRALFAGMLHNSKPMKENDVFSVFWASNLNKTNPSPYKNLIIEVPIVKHGSAQFKFDVSDGLKNYQDYQNWTK